MSIVWSSTTSTRAIPAACEVIPELGSPARCSENTTSAGVNVWPSSNFTSGRSVKRQRSGAMIVQPVASAGTKFPC